MAASAAHPTMWWLFCTFIVVESVMVPTHGRMTEHAQSAMLQKDAHKMIKNGFRHVDEVDYAGKELRSVLNACLAHNVSTSAMPDEDPVAKSSSIMALSEDLERLRGEGEELRRRPGLVTQKIYDLTHEEKKTWGEMGIWDFYADSAQPLYHFLTVVLTLAKMGIDMELSTAGLTASTSPATPISSLSECRKDFMHLLVKTRQSEDGTPAAAGDSEYKKNADHVQKKDLTALVTKAMKCITKDMDKCLEKIRTYEWISTGIENFQIVLDQMWALEEMRETKVALRRNTEARMLTNYKNNNEIQSTRDVQSEVDEDSLKAVDDTVSSISDMSEIVDSLATRLRARGLMGPQPAPL